MNHWIDTALIAIVLTNFLLLASSRLGGCIRIVASQGVILAVLLLCTHSGALTARVLWLAVVIVLVKGLILRQLLLRTLGKRREIEPLVGFTHAALEKAYAAVPEPRVVIAVGACAISGGPYAGHPEVHDGAAAAVPVDLYVPGCPPHPFTLLDGLLRLLGRLEGG